MLDDQQVETLHACYDYFLQNDTVEIPPKLFNLVHEKEKQKLLGITYTPEKIRTELTKNVIDKLTKKFSLKNVKICDPCCGSGIFSISLIEELNSRGFKTKDIIKNNVYLSDIDPLSVALAMLNIYSYFKRKKIDLVDEKISLNASVQDFVKNEARFHAFITNPPYVKLQNLPVEAREFLKKKYPQYFMGSPGLATLFLVLMNDRLIQDGAVGIITQNNLFTSNSAQPIRKLLQDKIFKIDTFGSAPIFKEVMTYTCLLYFSLSSHASFEFRKISHEKDFSKSPEKSKNKDLHHSKWRLGSQSDLENLKKLETQGIALGTACRIWVGIATQFDKAFTVFKEGRTWVSTAPDGSQSAVEADLVKPLIRVADLTSFDSVHENKRGIIYPYRIVNGKSVAITESEFKESYPKAYGALLLWKTELLGREKGRIEKEDWYKWGRVQSMIPVKDKLLTKTFNKGPKFYFDDGASLFSNGYAIVPALAGYDLTFVQKVLNSKVFEYYAKLTSFEIEGEYQCYQKNFIEKFCLPTIPVEEQKKLVKKSSLDSFLIDYFELQDINI